jgi:hypothetical protein
VRNVLMFIRYVAFGEELTFKEIYSSSYELYRDKEDNFAIFYNLKLWKFKKKTVFKLNKPKIKVKSNTKRLFSPKHNKVGSQICGHVRQKLL